MTDDPDLDELREQTQSGNRISEAKKHQRTFEDHVADALDRVDDGDINRTISLYDTRLAALVAALEADDETRHQVVGDLRAELGDDSPVDLDDVDRSELLGLAIRVGLKTASPGVLDDAKSAYTNQVDF